MIQKLLQRVFLTPQFFRDAFLEAHLIKGRKEEFPGKSFICVSLTRFCPVGCDFCFFKSGNPFKDPTKADRFFLDTQNRFIQFSNRINLGYLLVSGGGEPLMERGAVLKIIEEVISDRIVLVTSGNWAKEKAMADMYLSKIADALKKRSSFTELTVRLSFDKGHNRTLGFAPAKNLIELFKTKYQKIPGLTFQIHTFENDLSLSELLDELKEKHVVSIVQVQEEKISDGISAKKIVPNQSIVSVDDYAIKVGHAKLFYSDLLIDLNHSKNFTKNIEVFQKDLIESEEGNPSVVSNHEGHKGLDFWVNYNGNVTTWGNQYLDNLMNLYTDSPEQIIEKTLSDPAAYSFLEKGSIYRDRIVSEVNPIAVLRGKAVNIRDYTSALMFDEARTRLYYTIRALQDYKRDKRISQSKLETLPIDIRQILDAPVAELKKAYCNAGYTIVEQIMEQPFEKNHVSDILIWIKLNHYQISKDKIEKFLAFYNANVSEKEKFQKLDDVTLQGDNLQIVRMTEHLTHIKADTLTNHSANF